MLTLARRLRDGIRGAVRSVQLQKGLAELTRTLEEGREPQPALMRRLVHGWGNEAWCARPTFLRAMLEWMPKTSGSIVECGSGLSTLILASAAATRGRHVHSLEHDAGWASLVSSKIPAPFGNAVSLLHAPLKSYGEFEWYGMDERALPATVGYVVCDGPPAATRGGRYGAGAVLAARLSTDAVILLDDTQRAEEHAILERWCSELGGSVVQRGDTFTAIRIDGARRTS